MVHSYTVNSLYGHDSYIKKCTCGYEERIKKAEINSNINISSGEFCKKCKTPLMAKNCNTLTLAPMLQQGHIANLKTYNKSCFFELELYSIRFYSKIDFAKKSIKVDKRTVKNTMVKMVFDASQKPDDFIKYYNEDGTLIDRAAFLSKIPDNIAYVLENYKDINNKFSFLINHFTRMLNKERIIKIILSLEVERNSFIKYEQLIKSNVDPFPIEECIDLSKTNPIDMLGIRPFTFKYIREQKNHISLALLKTIKFMEEEIGDQTVNYLQTFGKRQECMSPSYIKSILQLIKEADLSVSKLYKYIYKEVPIKQFIINPVEIITLLKDTFEMSKHLGLVFNKNSKTLKRYHDELMEEYKAIEDQVLSKKFKQQMAKKKYLEYELPNNKYCMIIPEESQELVKEGKELRHCVGSYIKRVAEGKSFIIFLRKKEDAEKSYTTIEVNEFNEIVQIRKKHNASLENQDAIDFVKSWVDKNNLICKAI